ncbi:ABC transporter permease [Lysinibacillus sp. 54212]|uniref:ABC transporter permease n=1 Tax=Lysinibacillus sp. 54212 TaxID=3119829 RepID=UPI002FC700C4
MNISIKRIQAIFLKDYKEFSRNYAISTMALVPLVLAFFYRDLATTQMIFLPINMTFAMVTTYIQCCLIAEEKERNTLRGLLMSPASVADILIGKSSLVFSISAIIIALTVYLVGYEPANIVVLSLAIIVSIVFYIILGTICGLFAKTIMEAGVAVLPVMSVFSFGPTALIIADRYPILELAQWLPSAQLLLLVDALEATAPIKEIAIPFVVIIVWMLIATFAASILYKKRMTDE